MNHVRWPLLVLFLSLVARSGSTDEGPVSVRDGTPLPFPVVLETEAKVPPFVVPADISDDLVYLTAPNFVEWQEARNAVGMTTFSFESATLRQSKIENGKVTIPAGALTYLAEPFPGLMPLFEDTLIVHGKPLTLVDFDQVIAVQHHVALPVSKSVAVGGNIFSYELGLVTVGTFSATVAINAVSGLDWSPVGAGTVALSTEQPAWNPNPFRRGLYQGDILAVTPGEVSWKWLSSNRMDAIYFADRTEFRGELHVGESAKLASGGEVKLVSVQPQVKHIELMTPDGPRTLSADIDATRLPEDAEARKKIIWRGDKKAIVLIPMGTSLEAGTAYLAVYSNVRAFRWGELVDDDPAWRVYPIGCYTGHSGGLYFVNDKPIELTPEQPSVSGPERAYQLTTTWDANGALRSFHVEDREGGKTLEVPAADRQSVNFIAGDGPTVRSLLRVLGPTPAQQLTKALGGAGAPAQPAAMRGGSAASRGDGREPGLRYKLTWALVGAAFAALAFAAWSLRRART